MLYVSEDKSLGGIYKCCFFTLFSLLELAVKKAIIKEIIQIFFSNNCFFLSWDNCLKSLKSLRRTEQHKLTFIMALLVRNKIFCEILIFFDTFAILRNPETFIALLFTVFEIQTCSHVGTLPNCGRKSFCCVMQLAVCGIIRCDTFLLFANMKYHKVD